MTVYTANWSPDHDELCGRGSGGSLNTGCEKCLGIRIARDQGFKRGYQSALDDMEAIQKKFWKELIDGKP